MKQFIEKTSVSADILQMKEDFIQLLKLCPWPIGNQIGLRHRIGASDFWIDGHGSLYDCKKSLIKGHELEFSEWNPQTPNYVKNKIIDLANQYQFSCGRVRYMRLLPKTGLTVHSDSEERYHYVLETNTYSYMCLANTDNLTTQGWNIPADGNFYRVDTTQPHFVYNGGKTERIHLVICAI